MLILKFLCLYTCGLNGIFELRLLLLLLVELVCISCSNMGISERYTPHASIEVL